MLPLLQIIVQTITIMLKNMKQIAFLQFHKRVSLKPYYNFNEKADLEFFFYTLFNKCQLVIRTLLITMYIRTL